MSNNDENFTTKSPIRENEANNSTIIPRKNKKKNDIKKAALYDNLISSSYTLHNGELDKEKITNQQISFVMQT